MFIICIAYLEMLWNRKIYYMQSYAIHYVFPSLCLVFGT